MRKSTMPVLCRLPGLITSQRTRTARLTRLGQSWRNRQLHLETFEDRSVPSVTAPTNEWATQLPNQPLLFTGQMRQELVIVDPRVANYQAIINDLLTNQSAGRHFDIVILKANEDGLDQINRLLSNRRGLAAIHFISHGNSSGVQLGGTWLDNDVLLERRGQIANWSKSLRPGADLLFYGCDLASGSRGRELLDGIRALSGADVAASTDKTGAASLGGDWTLEYSEGSIDSAVAFSAAFQRTYAGTLATFVVTSTADSGAGSLRNAITQANAAAGLDTITFAIAGAGVQTISLLSALPSITQAVIIDGTTQTGFAGVPLIELDGTAAGAAANGLTINGNGTTIRGLIINRFGNDGVLMAGSGNHVIVGNYIGLSSNGLSPLGNGNDGIEILSDNNTVGGTTAADRNVISSNAANGVEINAGNNNTITGNFIGTDITGVNPLGNAGHGVFLNNGASNNSIGGVAAGAGNVIAFSGGDGIRLTSATTTSNQFLANSIHDNVGLGIDLNGDGPTPNDFQDPDSGANADKNFPIITSVQVVGGQVTIVGSYNGVVNTSFRLEFFASSIADPSGFGEGERFLGFINVTTDGNGDATFSVTFTAAVAAGEFVSGTATDLANGNSSEFSPCVAVTAPGVIVTPTSGLVTTEAGGKASFTVVLASKPTANVVIPISVSLPGEANASVVTLTFTSANWNIAQTVTVTGLNDFVVDGDQPYTIIVGAAISTDLLYNGIDGSDVSAINLDDDVAGFIVTPTSGLTTTEAGGQASFTVRLTSQPVGSVTINISSSNPGEGTVNVSFLTFDAGNWNLPQTVIITGVNEFIVDGNQTYTIILSPAVSSDSVYAGLDPTDVSVVNVDNDVASIIVTPVGGLTTTEAGGTAAFTVRLTSQPAGLVTINVASSNPTEGTVNVVSLIFDAGNWNLPQTVTITGVDDFVVDGNQAYTIILSPAISADGLYNGMDPTDVSVINIDDDTNGFVVTPLGGLVTTEAGGNASFTVRLASQPTGTVTINVASSNPGEGVVSVSSLTFDASNWNVPQVVTITGVNDFIADGNQPYTIVLSPATSTDLNYNGLDPADVGVVNLDDDVASIIVTPTNGLITTEAGSTASFGVRLTSQPTAAVTFSIVTSNPAEGVVNIAFVTFDALNWNLSQLITITGVDDFFADGNVGYTIVLSPASSLDATYNGMDPTDVSVVNLNDDFAGIRIIGPANVVVDSTGTTSTIFLSLSSQPFGPVTIQIVSADPTAVGFNPVFVTFTGSNWSTPVPVTLFSVTGNKTITDLLVPISFSGVSTDAAYDGMTTGVTALRRAFTLPPIINPGPNPSPGGPPTGQTNGPKDGSTPGDGGANGSSTTAKRLPDGGGGGDEAPGEEAPAPGGAGSSRAKLADKTPPATAEVISPYKPLIVPPKGAVSTLGIERSQAEQLGEQMAEEKSARASAARLALGTVVIASAGCVLWSLRGAAWLLSAVATAAPAWTAFDPMTLLSARQRRKRNETNETLADMTVKASRR